MSDATPPQDPPQDFYQYADRAQAALLDMVRGVMQEAAEDGLPGGHHFYLTYYTQADGVEMSDSLRAKHPQEITIVLQNQFDDLQVTEEGFEVTLSFNNTPERLRVPFAALSKFYDPSVAFGLMFDVEEPDSALLEAAEELLASDFAEEIGLAEDSADAPTGPPRGSGEVVSLDSFRDK